MSTVRPTHLFFACSLVASRFNRLGPSQPIPFPTTWCMRLVESWWTARTSIHRVSSAVPSLMALGTSCNIITMHKSGNLEVEPIVTREAYDRRRDRAYAWHFVFLYRAVYRSSSRHHTPSPRTHPLYWHFHLRTIPHCRLAARDHGSSLSASRVAYRKPPGPNQCLQHRKIRGEPHARSIC